MSGFDTPPRHTTTRDRTYAGIMPFTPGDLIYGLQSRRAGAANYFRHLHGSATTIDEFNNLMPRFTATVDKHVVTEQLVQEGRLERDDMQRFLRYIQFMRESSTARYYKLHTMSCHDSDDDLWTSRSCKAAIRMTTENEHMIHFILDGIDLPAVVDAEHPYYKKFTSIELRSIFKSQLSQDTYIKRFVTFYKNGEVVEAPWVMDRELWVRYAQHKAQNCCKK